MATTAVQRPDAIVREKGGFWRNDGKGEEREGQGEGAEGEKGEEGRSHAESVYEVVTRLGSRDVCLVETLTKFHCDVTPRPGVGAHFTRIIFLRFRRVGKIRST